MQSEECYGQRKFLLVFCSFFLKKTYFSSIFMTSSRRCYDIIADYEKKLKIVASERDEWRKLEVN